MWLPERVVWTLAVLYATVVTAVAGGLLLGGSLLGGLPGVPPGVERRYGASTMRVVDVLFRPVDALPSMPLPRSE